VAGVTLTGTINFPGGLFYRGDSVENYRIGFHLHDRTSDWRLCMQQLSQPLSLARHQGHDNYHATISLQTASFFALANSAFHYRFRDTLTYLAVHFWALADGSDAEGGGKEGDPDAILIGPGGYHCRGLVSFNGALYVARDDGVWAVDETVTPPLPGVYWTSPARPTRITSRSSSRGAADCISTSATRCIPTPARRCPM